MMMLLTAAFANPTSIQVTYTVQFDVDATGDRMCSFTKLCDCTSTYQGVGQKLVKEEDRLTFEGTWTRTANTCSDPLLIWAPDDEKAFHTLRTAGGRLTEWVVHGDAARHTKLATEMKANQQFWIDDLQHPWPAKTVSVQQTDGDSIGGMLQLTATHHLSIQAL